MREELALLPLYGTAHLRLTLAAVFLGAAFSIPTGIWLTRHRSLEQGVLGVASVIQTIPSLALLAIMVPALAALGGFTSRAFGVPVPAIGVLPALIGLTLYSVLPILRNTVIGISGVDAALVEAARGVGMTDRQQLWRVELPLALPVIVAGLRTAIVWVVGMATLSTPVGAPSLGNYIFAGLQTRNLNAVLVGCVAAAVLALSLDSLVHLLEVGIRRRRPLPRRIAIVLLLLLYAYAAGSFALEGLHAGGAVRVGSKTFTEQYVLSEILVRTIERTGVAAEAVPSLGSTVAFDALRSGAIDAYVDYSGTVWATVLGRDRAGASREEVLREVREALERDFGIHVLGALGFENAYALAMRRRTADQLGIRTISDLAVHAPRLAIASDYEFFSRAEWASLERAYGLRFREQRTMDPSLMYEAAGHGDVDVISAYSTDGRIEAFDLRVVKDDRRAIPPYDAIVMASEDLVRDRPEVARALARLAGTIDAERMRHMNFAVDELGKSPGAVAEEFLRSAGHKNPVLSEPSRTPGD
ncbi:MAG: osmoprotectant transport system substrate-binding protein opuBD [Candidatus Binatota bacterium]|nr:osmoprotectant transport system substrate-binding protein opuBD [Candidatus Binatota bacterium]